MNIGITSIQKNRNPYILEWLAFHMAVGFNKFYIYAHSCTDGMVDTLLKLSSKYPIHVFDITAKDTPQLVAYQHSCDTNLHDVDWMAFIDGDEFVLPIQDPSIELALQRYDDLRISALAVYWICYGSSGHLEEPSGLIFEKFTRHSSPDFCGNRHIKSIVRGRQTIDVIHSHIFKTQYGTFDESLRPIHQGFVEEHEPTTKYLRINHYVTQSYEYFKNVKQSSGQADQLSVNRSERGDDWFFWHDRNECDDGISYRFLVKLKLKYNELSSFMSTPS